MKKKVNELISLQDATGKSQEEDDKKQREACNQFFKSIPKLKGKLTSQFELDRDGTKQKVTFRDRSDFNEFVVPKTKKRNFGRPPNSG